MEARPGLDPSQIVGDTDELIPGQHGLIAPELALIAFDRGPFDLPELLISTIIVGVGVSCWR